MALRPHVTQSLEISLRRERSDAFNGSGELAKLKKNRHVFGPEYRAVLVAKSESLEHVSASGNHCYRPQNPRRNSQDKHVVIEVEVTELKLKLKLQVSSGTTTCVDLLKMVCNSKKLNMEEMEIRTVLKDNRGRVVKYEEIENEWDFVTDLDVKSFAICRKEMSEAGDILKHSEHINAFKRLAKWYLFQM